MTISYNNTEKNIKSIKFTALNITILNLVLSIYIYITYDFIINQFQFVQEHHKINSYVLFLYTLLGSLFLLLSILSISSIMGTTDFDALFKNNLNYYTQLFLFYGIIIAFAVKTPTIFLNS